MNKTLNAPAPSWSPLQPTQFAHIVSSLSPNKLFLNLNLFSDKTQACSCIFLRATASRPRKQLPKLHANPEEGKNLLNIWAWRWKFNKNVVQTELQERFLNDLTNFSQLCTAMPLFFLPMSLEDTCLSLLPRKMGTTATPCPQQSANSGFIKNAQIQNQVIPKLWVIDFTCDCWQNFYLFLVLAQHKVMP